jgi:hypothetical protein
VFGGKGEYLEAATALEELQPEPYAKSKNIDYGVPYERFRQCN